MRCSKKWLQYSLAVFVGFLYSSLAVPGLYYFLEYSRLAGKYSRVTSKRKNINKFEAALLGWRVGSEAGFEDHLDTMRNLRPALILVTLPCYY